MNLWAKSFGRLAFFAVALFFFSCESEDSFLGFPNPTDKFSVTTVEIPLTSSVLAIDSIFTDNLNLSGSGSAVLIGEYVDPQFGNMTSESFVQIIPGNSTKIPATALFDSVTLQLRLNFYGYGFTGEQTQRFSIHELNQSVAKFPEAETRKFYYDALPYNATPLAEASVIVRYDSLKKQAGLSPSQQDTILAAVTLPYAYGQQIFNQAVNNDFSDSTQLGAFFNAIKGLALVPADMEGLIGLRIMDPLSRVTLHYRTTENGAVKDTLSRSYSFYWPSYSHISADRGGTELATLMQPYQSFEPASGKRYIQSGAPIITKLDLSNFYQFADQDSNKNLIINEAALIIDGVESPSGLDAHSGLVLKIMNNSTDVFRYGKVKADAEALAGYYAIAGTHYFVQSDVRSSDPNNPNPAVLTYNADTDQYISYLTFFSQSLFRFRNDGDGINENRLRFLGLQASSPSAASSVTRTIFNASSVKLRLKYTRPTGNTP